MEEIVEGNIRVQQIPAASLVGRGIFQVERGCGTVGELVGNGSLAACKAIELGNIPAEVDVIIRHSYHLQVLRFEAGRNHLHSDIVNHDVIVSIITTRYGLEGNLGVRIVGRYLVQKQFHSREVGARFGTEVQRMEGGGVVRIGQIAHLEVRM